MSCGFVCRSATCEPTLNVPKKICSGDLHFAKWRSAKLFGMGLLTVSNFNQWKSDYSCYYGYVNTYIFHPDSARKHICHKVDEILVNLIITL